MHYRLFFPEYNARGNLLGYDERPSDRRYEAVYSGTIDAPDHDTGLELIFERHTLGDGEDDRPRAQALRRMSVGDIVLFDEGGYDTGTAYIVQTVGFREVERTEVLGVFPDLYLGDYNVPKRYAARDKRGRWLGVVEEVFSEAQALQRARERWPATAWVYESWKVSNASD
jgi:hypothetical protein